MRLLRSVRCPNCGKLICRIKVKGFAKLDCVCSRCGEAFVKNINTLNRNK